MFIEEIGYRNVILFSSNRSVIYQGISYWDCAGVMAAIADTVVWC